MIEVGEYVRIDKDHRIIALGIAKVVKTINETIYVKNNFELPIAIDKDSISKHSKNIIDLIEAGDYVNGYKVISVDYDVINDKTECIELDLNNNYQYNFISARQIKTIITHEQFSSIEYKVGGEDE